MRSHRMMVCALVVAALLVFCSARTAQAQVLVAPAPVVSYYYAPAPVVAAPVAVPAAPVVSYYTAPVAAPVYYTAPAPVSYYVPATVRRGLFGRTIVRTPFYRLKY